jgi:hypothetical protein
MFRLILTFSGLIATCRHVLARVLLLFHDVLDCARSPRTVMFANLRFWTEATATTGSFRLINGSKIPED